MSHRLHAGLLVLALTFSVPAVGMAEDAASPVPLGECDMMATFTLDTSERLRLFLPPGYEIGANLLSGGTREVGVLTFWAFSCDAVEIPGAGTQPARFAFAAIAVETDERPTEATTTPRNFDHYNVLAHTDNPAFATWLGASGLPVTLVERIEVRRFVADEADVALGQRSVAITVPDASTGYSMVVHPRHPDAVGRVHDHVNTFWHEGPGGSTVFRLFIRDATDTACYLVVKCGDIRTEAGTETAELLGGPQAAVHIAADHVRLGEMTAVVETKGG